MGHMLYEVLSRKPTYGWTFWLHSLFAPQTYGMGMVTSLGLFCKYYCFYDQFLKKALDQSLIERGSHCDRRKNSDMQMRECEMVVALSKFKMTQDESLVVGTS